MSFLDAIPAEISAELAPEFRDGALLVPALVSDGEGGFTTSYASTPVKALRIDYSLAYRTQNDIPETDVSIIVLRYGLSGAPGTNHRITLGGVTYSVISVETDPADATWTLQARPI